MAKNPLIKRYLDAGMAFTQMTQSRAEAIVKDLVKQGEVKSKQAEDLIDQLVERSRANTEGLLEMVRTEVRDQLVALGLIDAPEDATPAPPSTPRAAPAKTGATGTTKAAAEGSTTKKAATKKRATKKAAAKKRTTKKAAAKRTATKKASPKKAATKKAATKKAAPGSSGSASAS
jgi:polyhydroxyalkanoate synthesis regulator phasin